MAASVEEVSYEFGSLSAVALLGSLISFIYSRSFVLPDGAPDRAGEGLQDAQLAIHEGHVDPGMVGEVLARAEDSFNSGFLSSTVLVTVVLLIGAWVTHGKLRGYALPEDAAH